MWKEKYEELKAEYDALVLTHDAIAGRVGQIEAAFKRIIEADRDGNPNGPAAALQLAYNVVRRQADYADPRSPSGAPANGTAKSEAAAAAGEAGPAGAGRLSPPAPASANSVKEIVYEYILQRAAEDPRVLAILTKRPELHIEVKREIIQADGGSLRGALGILISEHFFTNTRAFGDIRVELIRRGFLGSKAPNRQISQAVQGLVELGFLTSEESGYQAVPGMKVHIVESVTGKAARA